MERTDWLLTFLGVEPAGGWRWIDAAEYRFDPIRIMKGLFLAQNEDGQGVMLPLPNPPYDFQPYAYGPFTAAVYRDLDELLSASLVEREEEPGRTYARWRLTDMGRVALGTAERTVGANGLARLRRAKAEVMFRGFRALLRHVYQRYPDYAKESVLQIGR